MSDLPCQVCGYNLRGLTFNHRCPECGMKINRGTGGTLKDSDIDTPVVEEFDRTQDRLVRIQERERKIELLLQRQERLIGEWERLVARVHQFMDRAENHLTRFEDSVRSQPRDGCE